ncbi:phospho-sugar mutase [Psychrobacter sp. HD31]|uniref:phospho-sugar mutase n=1 Tax=Psychrobacter sp. HD31 TaxID=3112003 RepID=UPI003DA559CE
MNNVLHVAQNWADQDSDIETKNELQTLIDNNNVEELTARFSGRLQFGTAGLRGPLQAGSMGMNRVLVAQAAAGLAKFLLERNAAPSIVIGYDARKNSDIFAKDTAEIMQGMGVNAQIMPDFRPTPVLAYAVRKLNASAGVMVTASHNPPEDNGYKVFLGDEDDGAQIVPPNDALIAKQIEWVAANQKVDELPRSNDYGTIHQNVIDDYIQKSAAVYQAKIDDELKYVYTAMHGIGTQTLLQTLEQIGFPKPILVDEQCTPDGSFPTVSFPNPEEAGALDLAIAKAKEVGAEFIVANDPDADRLAVAVADDAGEWATLHGNEVGLYLAWHIAKKAQAEGKKGVLACSLVSSPALAKVAKATGLEHKETLTGFKWIGRLPNLIFGYEEALGYLVNPDCAHDKDGISAIICFLDLINDLKSEGKTLAQSFKAYRQEFTKTFGALVSDQISVRVEDLERINRILATVRNEPFTNMADFTVESYVDHLKTEKDNNILVFYLAGGHRVIFRPSGTEPKLKIYLDTAGETLAQAKLAIEAIKQDLEQYLENIA